MSEKDINKYQEYCSIYGIYPNILDRYSYHVIDHPNYDYVMALRYDLHDAYLASKTMVEDGLDRYIKLLEENYIKKNNCYYAPDETFCINYLLDKESEKFYILIEVVDLEGMTPNIKDIKGMIDRFEKDDGYTPKAEYYEDNGEIHPIEDEPMDPSVIEDDLSPYTLIVELKCNWPNMIGNYCSYKMAMPLVCVNEEHSNILYLRNNIEYLGRDGDTLHFGVSLNDYFYLDLVPGGKETFEFSYIADPSDEDTLREGSVTISLRKDKFIEADVGGRVVIHESSTLEKNGEKRNDGEEDLFIYVSNLNGYRMAESEEVSFNTYRLLYINDKKDFLILSVAHFNSSFPDDEEINYIPVYLNATNTFIDGWFIGSEGNRSLIEQTIKITYEGK